MKFNTLDDDLNKDIKYYILNFKKPHTKINQTQSLYNSVNYYIVRINVFSLSARFIIIKYIEFKNKNCNN